MKNERKSRKTFEVGQMVRHNNSIYKVFAIPRNQYIELVNEAGNTFSVKRSTVTRVETANEVGQRAINDYIAAG